MEKVLKKLVTLMVYTILLALAVWGLLAVIGQISKYF